MVLSARDWGTESPALKAKPPWIFAIQLGPFMPLKQPAALITSEDAGHILSLCLWTETQPCTAYFRTICYSFCNLESKSVLIFILTEGGARTPTTSSLKCFPSSVFHRVQLLLIPPPLLPVFQMSLLPLFNYNLLHRAPIPWLHLLCTYGPVLCFFL